MAGDNDDNLPPLPTTLGFWQGMPTCIVNDIVVQQTGHMDHLCDLRYPLLPPPLLGDQRTC